jgi:hypothetical protein
MKDSERKTLVDEWMEHAEHLHGGENAGTARALYEEIMALRTERDLLLAAHAELERELDLVVENVDDCYWPYKTPANDALDAWQRSKGGDDDEE